MNSGFTEWLKTGIAKAALALCLALLSSPGVARGEEPVPAPAPEAPTPTPAPAPAPASEGQAPAPEAQAPVPVPAPVATPADDAQKLLDQQAVTDEKLREELAAQASQHFQAGKELFGRFEYEEARRELELAVQLDRSNEEARKLLVRVNDILGVRRDRIKSAVAQLYGEYKVQVQEKLVELDNRIDWGKKFIQIAQTDPDLSMADRIRKYEQALSAFERARELIKWMPVEVSTDEQSNEVNRLIRDSQRAIKAAQARLQDADREQAERMAQEQRDSLRRMLDRKVNVMVDQAKALHETGRYESAINMANKILEIDPTNAEANTIIAISRGRQHIAKRKWIDSEYREQFTSSRERAERLSIPHKDYLIYPDNWKEIQQRQGQESARRAEEPWKQEIRKKLSRQVSFEFMDTPLEETINFLNQLSHINIILDPRVISEGANKTPITLRVQDMRMDMALKWILRLAELEYDLRGQAIFVTKKANLASNVELEIYDVRDLTTTVADFPAPHIEVGTAGNQQVTNPFVDNAASPSLKAADLQTLIHDQLLVNEFSDPATSITESNGRLVVMQRPEVHDRIRQLLRNFRETQTIQVLTQVRFIDVNDNFLEQIGVHFTGLDAAPGEPGLPNAAVDPLAQPSVYGLFPTGGGPGPTGLPSDVQPSTAFQFSHFQAKPPFHTDYGPPSSNPGPGPITLLRPRLDPNFPNRGNATIGPANAPVGIRRQWWEQAFGSPVLTQGLVQNLLRPNPLASVLGLNLQNNPQQGALFQFRFLQSVQASAILQAVRKDQTADQLLAPKLTQFNNQRSHILVAQQRSYIKDFDVSGAVFDPVISSFLVGVVLEVKPTVSNDKRYITMDLHPGTALEVAPPQIVFITNSGDVNNGGVGQTTINLPIELPNIELRSISTTVTVPDNGTMLFSGLITDRKIDAKSGVPLLSDLPIIGRFFSNNYKERVRRNLLVLINSRVILFDEEEARL